MQWCEIMRQLLAVRACVRVIFFCFFFYKVPRASIVLSQKIFLFHATAKPPGAREAKSFFLRQPQKTTTRRGKAEGKRKKIVWFQIRQSQLSRRSYSARNKPDGRAPDTHTQPRSQSPSHKARRSVYETAVGELSSSASPQVSVVIHGRSCHAGVASHGY